MATAFEELASVNGRISPADAATVPLKDDGLYRGDGAFEVVRIYAGRPFALGEHIDRLRRSAQRLELEFDRPMLEAEVAALLDRNGPADCQLRLIVTRGGLRIAATEPVPAHSATVAVATVTYETTVILDGVKSLSYAANMQATRLARGRGADEAVLVRGDGTVLEPPTASIFWVSRGGALRTSSLEDGVLASITRDRLVAALEVEVGTWDVEDLRSAGEAFLASTTREVQPIGSIDGRTLSDAPGPRTREAQEAFAAVLERELG